jgi:hypothetical protein
MTHRHDLRLLTTKYAFPQIANLSVHGRADGRGTHMPIPTSRATPEHSLAY